MSTGHERGRRKGGRVAEPVQVYLAPGDRARLERLADQMDATKSDVLRRGLEALELQLTDASNHPVLKIIGIADLEIGPPLAYNPAVEFGRFLEETEPGVAPRSDADEAREHDRVPSESEIASWKPSPRPRRAR